MPIDTFRFSRRAFIVGAVALGGVAVLAADGSVHATELGLVDSSSIDQGDLLEAAILKCSAERKALDISGLEIRVGTRGNSDPEYLYINGRGRRSPTFGIFLPPGTWMKIIGEGTLGNLEQNSSQYLFHAVDAEYIEIGDGVTMDGNKTVNASGAGTCHFMGCKHVHIGNATFIRDGIVRLGSSPSGMTQLCTFDQPRFIDCRGTHCIGGKPGGCKEWRGDTIRVQRSLGGLNLEAEDQNQFNDNGSGGKRWSDAINATINAVICEDLDGSLGGASSGVHAVLVGDCEGAVINIGSITLLGATAPNGVANALLVGGGQSDNPASSVKVGTIRVENAGQVVSYAPSARGGEIIEIGTITGNNVDEILSSRPLGGKSARRTPGRAKNITIDNIDFGLVRGEALKVENNSSHPGKLVDKLEIRKYRADESRARVRRPREESLKDVSSAVIGPE